MSDVPLSPRRVGLLPPQEVAVEVDLDGRIFTVRPMTRSHQAKIDEAEQALDAAATTDEAALRIIDVLDAMIEPTDGQRKTAGAILGEMWKADKISISQLSQLLEDMAVAANDRPT